MKKHNVIDTVALILLIIGGINWGLVGILNKDLVASSLGLSISRIIYILVGVAALYGITWLVKDHSK